MRKRYREGQEDQLGALGLVVNAVCLWNSLYLDESVRRLREEGADATDEDLARVSPLSRAHVNVLGRYNFDLDESLAGGGMRPLRNPSDPDQVAQRVRDVLTNAARAVGGNVLGGALNVVTGTVGFALTLFGVLFVGAYLLVDVRRFKAAFLTAAPHRYRRDAKTLWEAFGFSLSKYLGGLAPVLLIQGAVSAVGLFLLGVPYALALGAFVSVTAIIPYLGAWIGAIPAVVVALTAVSPTIAVFTALLFLGIQQLEGNLLTPKIQGDTLRVHPILVFLAVIIGGGLAGIVGVIVAVPSLAVLRVLFDFFRVRLTTEG